MARNVHEEFRVLFLDRKNALIADEVQGHGTVDHTPVYPREIVKRALQLSASAIILVHNHPMRRRSNATLLFMLLLVARAGGQSPDPRRAALAGTWTFNAELSDKPG